jgi:hypothetical protein
MSQWTAAVADMQSTMDATVEPPAYAGAVEGCVQRAVAGELDPTGRLALGRYPPYLVPGAGAWLAKKGKYDASDPDAKAGLSHAVHRALAVGYVGAANGFAIDAVPDRDDRDIYAIWAPSFTDRLANLIGKDIARHITKIGQEVFVDDLKNAGMARWLGGSKVGQIGMVLSSAGFLLWFTQSEKMPDDEFEQAAGHWKQMTDEDAQGRRPWAWEAFTV